MSNDKPLHPGFEIAEQFFRAFWYPPRVAARSMGMDTREFEEFLDGLVNLNNVQAKALENILSSWRTAGWILEQQDASSPSIDVK